MFPAPCQSFLVHFHCRFQSQSEKKENKLVPFWVVMEDFRSKSCGDGRTEMEACEAGGPPRPGTREMRSYSASHAPSSQGTSSREMKVKKGKWASGSSSSKSGWSLSDPELQRKKRVASYKVYAVEGKMKGGLRKSFRWIKDRCSKVVSGLW